MRCVTSRLAGSNASGRFVLRTCGARRLRMAFPAHAIKSCASRRDGVRSSALVLPTRAARAAAGAGGGGWIYAVQLTLEDATGEVDAALFDADGADFFQARRL